VKKAKMALLEAEIRHEKELRELTERLSHRALLRQGKEYARRLSELNNAHELAVREQARTLPRADFDTYKETTRRENELAKEVQDKIHSDLAKEQRTTDTVVQKYVAQIATIRGLLVFIGFSSVIAVVIGIYRLIAGS
jgi:hypothetical protein